jgi:hypothetical protein
VENQEEDFISPIERFSFYHWYCRRGIELTPSKSHSFQVTRSFQATCIVPVPPGSGICGIPLTLYCWAKVKVDIFIVNAILLLKSIVSNIF